MTEPIIRYSPVDAAARAAGILDFSKGNVLTEREAKQILAAYGVDVVTEVLVSSREAAISAVEALAGPAALKIESPAILHKTEADVIRLGVQGGEAAGAAFNTLMGNALKVTDASNINGVLVQPMVPSGVEMLIGGRVDPLFGPLIVVGIGGVLVEFLDDSALARAPVSHQHALAMINRLRASKLLHGFRNLPAVDVDRLATVVCRVSELVSEQRDRVSEIDVNPLICCGAQCIAVDGLITLAERTVS